jgi:hypothetical protein
MGEVIKFPTSQVEKTLPDSLRFFNTAGKQQIKLDRQREERAMWAAADEAAKKAPPTPAEIEAAKKEYDFLFSGDNAELSNAIADEGFADVMAGRPKTPAALFYGHVTDLNALRYGHFDVPRAQVEQSSALLGSLVIKGESS